MGAQLTGAATALVIFLAWVVVVECFMAAAVLLGEFIVLRVRVLRGLAAKVEPSPPVAEEPQGQVIIGGGIRRWE